MLARPLLRMWGRRTPQRSSLSDTAIASGRKRRSRRELPCSALSCLALPCPGLQRPGLRHHTCLCHIFCVGAHVCALCVRLSVSHTQRSFSIPREGTRLADLFRGMEHEGRAKGVTEYLSTYPPDPFAQFLICISPTYLTYLVIYSFSLFLICIVYRVCIKLLYDSGRAKSVALKLPLIWV
eukprot:COSAG06_NODE_1126_length_10609_cov_228.247383_9_plen_181_part_00